MKRLGALSGIVAAILAVTVAIAQPIDALGLFTSTRTVPANAFTTGSLAAPTSLAASPSGASIALSWSATVSAFATGYKVLRATASGGPFTAIGQVTPRTTVAYTDSTATAGITYYYVVQAYYQSWVSPNSNQASASTCTIALIQTATGGGSAASFSATFAATPTVGNMLIAVAGTRINGTMTAPAGWATAINEAANPAPQAAIFYKLAGPSEPTTVTVTTDATGNGNGIHLFEYRCLTTLDQVSSDHASSKAVASGSVTTTRPSSLIIAGLVARQGSDLTGWTNGFMEQTDFTQGAGGAVTVFAAADRIASPGTYSTTATSAQAGLWRGQIVAFH